jgi:protein TonB
MTLPTNIRPTKESLRAVAAYFIGAKGEPVALVGERTYSQSSGKKSLLLKVVLGLLMTVAIFMLLPFTQLISSLGRDRVQQIQVEISIDPPPPPELDLDVPPPPPPPPPPPDVEPPPLRVSLDAIDASLNLGTGGALGGVVAFEGFSQSADDTASDLSIFDIKDLDQAPRLLRPGNLVYPPELRRARVTGRVVLGVIIDERGNVTVEDVVEAKIRAFVTPAISFAEGCLFDTPKKNGKPVRARYNWPIQFSL